MSNYDDVDAVLMPPPSKRYRRGTNGTISSLPANASVVNARVIPWQVTVDCVEQSQIERGPDPIQLPSRESCESLEIHEQPPMNNESDGCTISQESFAMEGTTRQKHLNKRERTSMKNNKALPTRSSDEDEQQLDQEILQLTQVTTRFSDIIGHGSVKLRIDEILLPLALPPSLTDSILIGVRASPASILLYGPPGCGKTQLARAVAGEAQAAFMSVAPSDVLSKFVGESEASIRDLFKKASRLALRTESRCTVLFFDEIDSIGQSRGGGDENGGIANTGGSDSSSRRILAELLIQLTNLAKSDRCDDDALMEDDDGEGSKHGGYDSNSEDEDDVYRGSMDSSSISFATKVKVIVVAATNRPEDIDPALLRRFAIRLQVGLPGKRDRRKIINKHLSEIDNTLSKIQYAELALVTEGWSGSDLESLTREAAMAPIRECLRSAALVKRRAKKREQSGGDESSQENAGKAKDADECARNLLLKGFQDLRPVNFHDFENAVSFLLGNEQPTSSVANQLPPHQLQHRRQSYDTSSDSDSDNSS